MIYITGDLHGSIDIRKLLDNQITKQMTEDDYLIICGDFGLVYDYKRENRKERKWLNWLQQRPWTTLFADGNHECFPRLYNYPVKAWNGGHVHVVRSKVMHLMRGEVFEIEGNTIFVMGGASSHDRGPAAGDTKAVIGKHWWPEEIPSEIEMEYGVDNLERCGFKVDYVITHCLPTTFQDIVKRGEFKPDLITKYLELIYGKLEFKHWYCGHYHCNYDVNDKVTVVFSRIIHIGKTIFDSETMLGVPKFRKGDAVLFKHEGQQLLGEIKGVLPYGTLFKHEEPYYEIVPFEQKHKLTIIESQILEKSLIE